VVFTKIPLCIHVLCNQSHRLVCASEVVIVACALPCCRVVSSVAVSLLSIYRVVEVPVENEEGESVKRKRKGGHRNRVSSHVPHLCTAQGLRVSCHPCMQASLLRATPCSLVRYRNHFVQTPDTRHQTLDSCACVYRVARCGEAGTGKVQHHQGARSNPCGWKPANDPCALRVASIRQDEGPPGPRYPAHCSYPQHSQQQDNRESPRASLPACAPHTKGVRCTEGDDRSFQEGDQMNGSSLQIRCCLWCCWPLLL